MIQKNLTEVVELLLLEWMEKITRLEEKATMLSLWMLKQVR